MRSTDGSGDNEFKVLAQLDNTKTGSYAFYYVISFTDQAYEATDTIQSDIFEIELVDMCEFELFTIETNEDTFPTAFEYTISDVLSTLKIPNFFTDPVRCGISG